ncbi:MAG: deaminase [Desulfurobacteriaceae bacterium]
MEDLKKFIEMSETILEDDDNKSKVDAFVKAIEDYKTLYNRSVVEEILKKGIISSSKCLKREEEDNFFFYRNRTLQELGRFLRRLGNKVIDFEIGPVFWLAELVRRCIKILSEYRDGKFVKGRFVIDALRNPFEIEYFRNRYSNFYLFSILASKNVRRRRLKEKILLSDEEIKQLQGIENKVPSSKEELYEQNINFCVGKGDVFINNDDVSITLLTYQLGKYIALILNPGLVTPTKDEIFMQVAFTARYASGCISRQVGAVVTGKDGYVRGVGWNDVPEKQIPCLYRTLEELEDTSEVAGNLVFSDYELSSDFKNFALNEFEYNRKKWNKNFPFCFKDIQNQKEVNEKIKEAKKRIETMSLGVKGVEELKKIIDDFKNFKNPTRERALHAEENAFLQAAKVGGMSVAGGTLYSTDSPCQLCAKKSRQLFIERIVYIDDYPDISKDHTLCSGKEKTRPKIEMFSGAIGQAYFKLYAPFIPRRDELKLIL